MPEPKKPTQRYFCCYAMKSDAQSLCSALKAYGIRTHIRDSSRTYSEDWYGPEAAAEPVSYCVYLHNPEDYPKAVEFKRGFLAGLAIKGDPKSFLDGVMAAGAVRKGQMLRKATGKIPLLSQDNRRDFWLKLAGPEAVSQKCS